MTTKTTEMGSPSICSSNLTNRSDTSHSRAVQTPEPNPQLRIYYGRPGAFEEPIFLRRHGRRHLERPARYLVLRRLETGDLVTCLRERACTPVPRELGAPDKLSRPEGRPRPSQNDVSGERRSVQTRPKEGQDFGSRRERCFPTCFGKWIWLSALSPFRIAQRLQAGEVEVQIAIALRLVRKRRDDTFSHGDTH